MDSIPRSHEIEITYKFSSTIPKEINKKFIADFEGCLQIKLEGMIIFSEEDMLLAEFLFVCTQWLLSSEKDDSFIYDSMDYEDSPIISVKKEGQVSFFETVWPMDNVIYPVKLQGQEWKKAVEIFIQKLKDDIPRVENCFPEIV